MTIFSVEIRISLGILKVSCILKYLRAVKSQLNPFGPLMNTHRYSQFPHEEEIQLARLSHVTR